MQNKFIAAGVAAVLTLSVSAALAQDKKADEASQSFIKSAIEGNLAEIDAGQLAQQKGNSQAVKNFGAVLVTDHTEANTKAKAAAASIGVTPPDGTSLMEKGTYVKLKVLSGDTFDRSFASTMVSDHQDAIKMYQKESGKTDAAGQYAKDALPTLQKHLEMAQKLESEVAAPTTGSGSTSK